MDVGLRAMDYLLSYSALQQLQQLQAREASGNGEDGTEDLSAASPYSIDEPHPAIMKRGARSEHSPISSRPLP
jgi:hypothetical protein